MSDIRMMCPSASGLHRVAACPASWRMEQQCPDTESLAAESGTRIHQYLCDQSILLTDEEMETARGCQIILKSVADRWCGEAASWEVYSKETRRFLRRLLAPVFSGQEDVTLVTDDDRYLIADYKTGRIEPDPVESNMQLRGLAVLLAEELKQEGRSYESISAVIIQPWVTWSPCVVTYSPEDIREARTQVRAAVGRAMDENAQCVPSVSGCRYCKARGTCRALADQTEQLQVFDLPMTWSAKSPEQKRHLWRLAQMAKDAAADIERLVKADLRQGGVIPGLELKKGNTRRNLPDVLKAWEQLKGDLSAEQFIACCKVSITGLESRYHLARCNREGNDKLKKKDSKELFEALIEPAVSRSQDEASIVEITTIETQPSTPIQNHD